MAYTPTEWATGDVITAEKLNKMEEGIADASPIIIEGGEWSSGPDGIQCEFDVTGAELGEYIRTGRKVLFRFPAYENLPAHTVALVYVWLSGDEYLFTLDELTSSNGTAVYAIIGTTNLSQPLYGNVTIET